MPPAPLGDNMINLARDSRATSLPSPLRWLTVCLQLGQQGETDCDRYGGGGRYDWEPRRRQDRRGLPDVAGSRTADG